MMLAILAQCLMIAMHMLNRMLAMHALVPGGGHTRSCYWLYAREILLMVIHAQDTEAALFLSRLTRQRLESAIAAYDYDLLQGHTV